MKMRSLTGALALLIFSSAAQAQDFPVRPIRVVVPYPAASGADAFPRALGPRLVEDLGQPVIFENKPGASGSLGVSQVTGAAPDGYTLVATAPGSITIYPHLAAVPYDPVKDLVPVALIATTPHIISVNAKLPINSMKELIAYVKANPGKVNYASSGTTSVIRLAVEIFNRAAGIEALHVPYQGATPAVTSVAQGETQYTIADMATTLPLMRGGLVRGIAVAAPSRDPALPDMPTVAESGLQGYTIGAWVGIFAPAGTPQPIINRLNAAVNHALGFADVQERLRNLGGIPTPGAPDQLRAAVVDDITKYGKVIREAGIKAE
jgi:tripartite-type tricarboxylate transporter receptor subunit TctC